MTNFEIIPAIDILEGKCVRLTQGQYNNVEEFSSHPEEIAKKWTDLGAKRLHIVDLDGAKEGFPVNFKQIVKIIKSTNAQVQVGGGIRSMESIKEYINEGTHYIVLGTKAFTDKVFLKNVLELYDEKIILSLDLKMGRVALSGWYETIDVDPGNMEDINNIKQIIYTDISKDGTLSGPNLKTLEKIAQTIKSNIIVSGGISCIEDIIAILQIKKLRHSNISGAILGKSLYKGMINLSKAIEITQKELKLPG